MDFSGKTVWITGASSGIGAGMAHLLADKGARLVLSARNVKALEQVRKTCRNPEQHLVLPLDLQQAEKFPDALRQVIQFMGSIDVLLNNGGVSQRSLAADTDLAVDRRIMEINYFAAVALTKLVLPYMAKGGGGMIASVASVSGKLGSPRRSGYSGSKHALIGFMDCLRVEVAGQGIRVFVVAPGFVNTDISINALTGDGTPNGIMEEPTLKGLSVDKFCRDTVRAMEKERTELVLARGKARLGYHLHRLFPRLYHWVLVRIDAP